MTSMMNRAAGVTMTGEKAMYDTAVEDDAPNQ